MHHGCTAVDSPGPVTYKNRGSPDLLRLPALFRLFVGSSSHCHVFSCHGRGEGGGETRFRPERFLERYRGATSSRTLGSMDHRTTYPRRRGTHGPHRLALDKSLGTTLKYPSKLSPSDTVVFLQRQMGMRTSTAVQHCTRGISCETCG